MKKSMIAILCVLALGMVGSARAALSAGLVDDGVTVEMNMSYNSTVLVSTSNQAILLDGVISNNANGIMWSMSSDQAVMTVDFSETVSLDEMSTYWGTGNSGWACRPVVSYYKDSVSAENLLGVTDGIACMNLGGSPVGEPKLTLAEAATMDSLILVISNAGVGGDWQYLSEVHVWGEAVPEPATMTLLGTFALIGLIRRKK